MSSAPTYEQLRRLKNTVMGAGHRLSLLARSGQVDPEEAAALAKAAQDLSATAQRLEGLLAARRPR